MQWVTKVKSGIIEVSDLTHYYGEFCALNSVSFCVFEKEIFSFLGPNGAGKSTAINILTTLIGLQQGVVKIAGYDLATNSQKVRESIGIVFQEVTLDRDMTVWEILEFHGKLYGMEKNVRKTRISELLDLVELSHKSDEVTKNLSGGMKRRLEIARGLMTRPKILFLDEPTIGLDPQTRIRMWDYIRTVNQEGTTIFLTTHYMDEADQLSDRISIIDHGKITRTGTPEQLKASIGGDMIFLKTDDLKMTERLLEECDNVNNVNLYDDEIIADVKGDGRMVLPGILSRLYAEQITVVAADLKKPSMDDVFIHYTGKEIRDSG